MPRIDGYEVAGLIRARPRSSRVPILFLTAFNKDDLHVFRGYSAGAVDYVFKPIEPLILKSKVDVFVDLYRKTEEIRRQGARSAGCSWRTCGSAARSWRPNGSCAGRRGAGGDPALAADRRHLPRRAPALPGPVHQRQRRAHHRLPGEPLHCRPRVRRRPHPSRGSRPRRRRAHGRRGGRLLSSSIAGAAPTRRPLFLDQGVLSPRESGRSREIFGMWFDVTERSSSSRACSMPASSRPSAGSPAASRTTSTTC